MLIALQQTGVARDLLRTDTVVVESPLPGGAAAVARFFFNTVPQWVQIAGVFVAALVVLVVVIFLWRRRARLRSWFAAKSGAWKLGFAAILLLALGGVGFAGLKSWTFMMHDNGFCTGCHVMSVPFRKFTASEHSKLGCHDCHRQGMLANARQLYQWVAERPEKIGAHAPVPNRICDECHIQRDADSTWKRISATAGHAVHLNPRSPAMRGMQCVTCHGEEVHRFKPADQTCAQSGCHDHVRIELGRMAGQTSLHCSTCHQFTTQTVETNPTDSARAALVPNQEQCLECHEMREKLRTFKPENDPHKGTCGACHNPHTQTTVIGAYQSCATAQCHARSDTLTAMHRGLTGRHKLETCGACHVAHTWKVARTDCRSCHTGITDPAVQTRRPSATESDVTTPRIEPIPQPPRDYLDLILDRGPFSTHGPPFRPFNASWGGHQAGPAFTLRTAGRVGWRRVTKRPESRSQRSGRRAEAADSARFAHARHGSLSCTTCHATTDVHGGLKALARQCTACHHANTALGRECERCHEPSALRAPHSISVAVSLSVTPAPKARALSFEHSRHARVACAECHAANLVRSVERTCASCHADHHDAVRDCTSCHGSARSTHTRALHASGCGGAGCHAREASAATSDARNVCLACHIEQADHKPGRECAPCHLTTWRAVAAGRAP
jgi:hypothetical protein